MLDEKEEQGKVKREMKREVLLIDMLVRDGKEKHGLYKGV